MTGVQTCALPICIRIQAGEDYYSYIVKKGKVGKVTKQDAANLIGESVKIYKTPLDILEDFSTLFLNQTEKLLTGTSIRSAYIDGARRGLEGEALKNYASDGGAKTQSMYNDEDKPALLRSLLVKTGAPYQTFAFEVMNTFREWAGKTGTPPSSKMQTMWQVIRFLAAASVFSIIAKKAINKEVWTWKRPPIPFAEFWLSPIIGKLTGQYIGSASGLTSPIQTATRVGQGIKDVMDGGSWRKLRNELLRYGPGLFGIPGGTQLSRTVDAIIAYSVGGIRDKRGRLLFEIKTPKEVAQATFGGVWSVAGGREYIKTREKPIFSSFNRAVAQINRVYQLYKYYQKEKPDKAIQIREKYPIIGLQKAAKHTTNLISKYKHKIKDIQSNKELSRQEKQQRIIQYQNLTKEKIADFMLRFNEIKNPRR